MPWTSVTPHIPVRDLPTAHAFYLNVLGCSTDYQDDGLVIVSRDAVALHLAPMPDESWRQRPADSGPVVSGAESFLAGTAALRIAVDDAAALYHTLLPLGCIHPNGALNRKPWGAQEFAVLDPDGNCLTFVQWDD